MRPARGEVLTAGTCELSKQDRSTTVNEPSVLHRQLLTLAEQANLE